MDWEKIKVVSWSAIGGAVALAIVGFTWGGWVTNGSAQEMAEEMASQAVVSRLTRICVARFNQDAEKGQKLEELKKKDYWDGPKYVAKQGWATMLGDKEPDSKVAEGCAEKLMQKT